MPEPADEPPVLRAELRELRPRGRLLAQPGPGDWVAVGDHRLDRLRRWAGLAPDHRVLELGCGPGRNAVALGTYLRPDGSYEGVDVEKRVIRWCRRHVTPRWPEGRFTHIDVWNGAYNRRGRIQPADVRFPFADGEFDLVFATSVFTHMLDADVRRYLDETARVLRPGGRVLATFFLVGEGARSVPPTDWDIAFAPVDGTARLVLRPEAPEKAVAYEEDVVLAWFADAGLTVEAVHHGEWIHPGGGESYDYQDTVVARRPD